eukprot:6442428-Prymnesium_polylepis.1
MLRPRGHHRRSPSAPASLPSPAQLLAGGGARRTPGSSTRASAALSLDESMVVHLNRIDGSFGLTLNDFNRV